MAKLAGSMKKYEEYQDEELIRRLRDGDGSVMDYLMEKYKDLVRRKARLMYLPGADQEDLIQEGMIGLFKAVRDYDPEKNAGFYSFAELCIRRQLISALKGASRLKHGPLNTYVSLNKPVQEDSERTLMDVLGGSRLDDPETLLISREEYTVITGKIERVLSDFEKQVLEAYLSGYSYRDIAKQTGAQPKSVDNALQRIKKKLERALGRSR